jgi:hypothetical protein
MINPYSRLVDPLAIARLDAPDFGPLRMTYGMGFGWAEDSNYPGYRVFAEDTGAGILTHLFFTARTPDTATGYKLIVDQQLLRSASGYDFYRRPAGYLHAPLDTTIGEARLCDVQIPYHHGFRLLYKTNDYHSWFDYGWRPLPSNANLPADSLSSPILEQEQQQGIAVFDNPSLLWQGLTGHDTSVWIGVPAGHDTDLLTITGSAVVERLWLDAIQYDSVLDSVWLDIYYDGEGMMGHAPSISTPLLALFGQSFDFRELHALPIDFSKDSGFTMRLPMPFARGLRVALRNRSSHDVAPRCSIRYLPQAVDRAKLGYLHAEFNEIPATRYHVPHHVLHRKGKGSYIGLLMGIHNLNTFATYEGDAEFVADSNAANSFHYEGTEDYFNGAQYFSNGNFLSPFGGTSNVVASYYRFHYLDKFDFRKSFDFDFQHGNDDDTHEDYRTLAFWYEQHIPFWTDRDTVRDDETLRISGAGYGAGETISILFDSVSAGSLVASNDGTFSQAISIPSNLHGFHTLSVNGVTYPESILITDHPTVQILSDPKPLQLQTGDTIQFSGEGYRTGDSVQIRISGVSSISHISIDSLHHIAGWSVVPDLPDGDYRLSLLGLTSGSVRSEESFHTTRILIFDCEDLWNSNSSPRGTSRYLNLAGYYSYDWRKNAVLAFQPDSTARQVGEKFFLSTSDTFSTILSFTQGTRFGNFEVLIDGMSTGSITGFGKFDHAKDTIFLGNLILPRGYHTLAFRYTGHDPASTDSLLWADFIRLTPHSPSPNLITQRQPRDSLNTISLFPDPADQYVSVALSNIATGVLSIVVMDILGREVLRMEKDGSSTPSIQWGAGTPLRIPVSSLTSGAYTLRVETNGRVMSGPFRIIR